MLDRFAVDDAVVRLVPVAVGVPALRAELALLQPPPPTLAALVRAVDALFVSDGVVDRGPRADPALSAARNEPVAVGVVDRPLDAVRDTAEREGVVERGVTDVRVAVTLVLTVPVAVGVVERGVIAALEDAAAARAVPVAVGVVERGVTAALEDAAVVRAVPVAVGVIERGVTAALEDAAAARAVPVAVGAVERLGPCDALREIDLGGVADPLPTKGSLVSVDRGVVEGPTDLLRTTEPLGVVLPMPGLFTEEEVFIVVGVPTGVVEERLGAVTGEGVPVFPAYS